LNQVFGFPVPKVLWRMRIKPMAIQGEEDVRNFTHRRLDLEYNEVYARVILEARIVLADVYAFPVEGIFIVENVRYGSVMNSFIPCSTKTVQDTACLSLARMARNVGANVPWNFVMTGMEQ
jgi:hypothetical protein